MVQSIDEANLIRQSRAGDEEALSQLLAYYAPSVRAVVSRVGIPAHLQSLVTVDDCLQEAWVDVFLRIKDFREQDATGFPGWLCRIARSKIVDAIRHLTAAKRGGAEGMARRLSLEVSSMNLAAHLADDIGTPSEQFRRGELVETIRAAVARLPDAYRDLVTWYDLEQRTPDEVAALCGCSPGAMFMRRQRAHYMLAQDLRGFLSTENPRIPRE